jgi:dihydroxyacetone kinase phosphoprotein-dependent L subunit
MQIARELIEAIRLNRQRLSDIDGLVGDGDHGVNMDNVFRAWGAKLDLATIDLSAAFALLSGMLLETGGAMGPLYGGFFVAMAKASQGHANIDRRLFLQMLTAAEGKVQSIGGCERGDKTIFDVLASAREAYERALDSGSALCSALAEMSDAAVASNEATKGLIARKGRAARLGERSRGMPDAGAASCCIILTTMSKAICAMAAEPANAADDFAERRDSTDRVTGHHLNGVKK